MSLIPVPKRLEGSWWNTPQTYEALAAITVPTIEKRALELTPWEWLQLRHLFIGTDGTPNLTQDTTGRNPVTITGTTPATDIATIKSYEAYQSMGQPLAMQAGGTFQGYASSATWVPVQPVQCTRAAGAVPDTAIVGATAAKKNDLVLMAAFYTAGGGTFTLAIEEDHAGTPAATDPDWGAVSLTLPAGTTIFDNPYALMRLMNSNANKDIGFDGSACTFPADGDWVTVWGYNRTV